MSDNGKPLHIVELRAENVKRLRVVRIRPEDGSLVLVGGANGAGKSSTLDAIEMALGGAKAIPPDPIRHGARKAEAVVDLGEIVVERSFGPKGTTLVVKGADGTPIKSPQALLDSLWSAISWDPLAFTRWEPKKQDEALRRALGLDFTELDGDRAQIFARRTEENRELKKLKARLDSLPEPEAGLPAAEVSSKELLAKLDEMAAVQKENEAVRVTLRQLEQEAAARDEAAAKIETRLAELHAEVAKLEADLSSLADSRLENAGRIRAQQATVDALVEPDMAAVRQQLADLEVTNRKVRARLERDALEKELCQRSDKVTEMTEALAYIDQKKQAALSAAKFPVAGLGFDDLGPTLDGVPLEQASQSQKLRVAVAIGAALHPRIRVVLIREGAFLDRASLQLLAELAAEQGLQCWVERVGDGDPGAIIIEEGMVRTETSASSSAEARG